MKDPSAVKRAEARAAILETLNDLDKRMGDKKLYVTGAVELLKTLVFPVIFNISDVLRERIELLEDAQIKYQGTHTREQQYNANDMVTAKGALWIATKSTRAVPGSSASGWKLMHKSQQGASKQ